LTKQQQEQKRPSWHLFEKAKADKMKAYWRYRNPSFGLATKAKGNCKGAGQRKARELSQEEARELSQEDARELRQEEVRESHHILLEC
jgi:hypothetical protein